MEIKGSVVKKQENTENTRQERRAARRKAEILEAAAKVFAEKGFHRTTTKDIAEAADIAEGTIYNYFENKDDLLISLIDWLADLDYRRETYEQSLDKDFRQAFQDLLAERISLTSKRNTLFLAILPEIFVTPHLRNLYKEQVMAPGVRDLEKHLRERIERNQIEPVDVSLVVRVLGALGLGFELLAMMDDVETQALWNDTPRLVELLTKVTFDGLLKVPPSDSASEGN